MNARVTKNVPSRFTAMTRRHSTSVMASVDLRNTTPALFTTVRIIGIVELLAVRRGREVQRIGDVVVRVGDFARLARERRLVLVVLDVERVDRVAFLEAAVRAIPQVLPARALDFLPRAVEVVRRDRV